MKFLIFSDLHYYPNILYGTSWETLRMLQNRAEENNCDFMIHGGDFCYGYDLSPKFLDAYTNFHIPSYHCLGNHDCDHTSYEDTLRHFKMPEGHYYFDCKGYRMIVMDTNYFIEDGKYIHYSKRNYRTHPESRDNVPPEQLKWLEETIEASSHPCLILSHASFERECVIPKDHEEMIQLSNEANGSIDGEKVRHLLRRINEKTPRKVLMVMNGHHHRDNLRLIDNILYWDINSTTYDWVCDKPHDKFPKELIDHYKLANRTVAYNTPLSAVVTLEGSTITIEGSESTMFMGVTREMVGDTVLDRSGRPTRPKIQSAKITLL